MCESVPAGSHPLFVVVVVVVVVAVVAVVVVVVVGVRGEPGNEAIHNAVRFCIPSHRLSTHNITHHYSMLNLRTLCCFHWLILSLSAAWQDIVGSYSINVLHTSQAKISEIQYTQSFLWSSSSSQ